MAYPILQQRTINYNDIQYNLEQPHHDPEREDSVLRELYEKRRTISAEWNQLFERETILMQKQNLSSEELDELDITNSRFRELLGGIEQLENGIHAIYMSKRAGSKE